MPESEELKALKRVEPIIEGLSPVERERVMGYLSEKYGTVAITLEYMSNLTAAMEAINKAANQMHVSGVDLVAVIYKLYKEGVQNDSEEDKQEPRETRGAQGEGSQAGTPRSG